MQQWTVGRLRAELVGLPDDMPISVLVATSASGDDLRRHVLTSAGYGPGIDPSDELLAEVEFPLRADLPHDGA